MSGGKLSLANIGNGINTAIDDLASVKPGEVLCNQKIAENLDKQLRNQARGVAHSMERFKALIDEAKTRCIYPMLGFKSWTAYIADVVGKEMHQLPVDDRRQIVALLAGEGMSQRTIAEAVGVNHATISRDQAAIKEEEVLRDATPEPVDAAPDPAPATATVTGRDGKQYPAKPDAPRPQREPKSPNTFVSRFYRALSDLQHHALRLELLTKEKGFAEHLDQLSHHHRDGVAWAQEIITRVLEQMHTGQDALFADIGSGHES